MLVIGALTGSICANLLVSLGFIEAVYAANIVVIAMTALFSSSVRAPITGTVLIMEMTASYQQLLTLAIAAMVAFVIAELFHSKPIYEELLNRMLQKDRPAHKTLEQRNVVEISLCSGSSIASFFACSFDFLSSFMGAMQRFSSTLKCSKRLKC